MRMNRFHGLRLIIRDIFASGMYDKCESSVLYKLMMLNLVLIIGTPFVIGFGLFDIYKGVEPLGYIITVAGLSCAACFYYLRRTKHYFITGYVIVFILFWMFLYLLATGGSGNSGVLWYYSFPPIVLFLFGFKKGSAVVFASLLLSGLILFLPGTPFLSATYSADIKLRFIPTVLVLWAVTSLFEHVMTAALKIEIKNKELRETIEELNQAEKALRESEKKYRSLFDSTRDGIFQLDADGAVTHMNLAGAEIFGYKTTEEILGTSLADRWLNPEDRDVYLRELKIRKAVSAYSIKARKINGDPIELEASSRLIEDDSGNFLGIEGILRDVTERRQAEEKAKALEVTELANKAKDAFLATMSHEMRTPLQSIFSYLALLSRTPLTDDQTLYLNPINHSAVLLKTLINDILDLTRIEQGNIHINCIPFDIRELLTSTVGIHKPEAESRGLGLDCLIAPDIPSPLKGDPDRLRQILHNLLGNAIKFTEQGGISIEVEHKSDFASDGIYNGVELLFRVRDSGIGIAKEKQEVIFESFKQAHEGYSRRYGGIGLGLSISRKLLQHMGGSMWVESEPNKGSTFYFTIKFVVAGIDEYGGAQPSKTQAAVPGGKPRKKILIVDDEKQCSFSLELILKTEGHTTATACSGKDALERLKTEEFDLIFMDVSMPEMDGIEATKMIRYDEKGTGRHTPVIALTGHGYEGDIAKFKQTGMDGWLIKPVTYDDLLAMLDNYPGAS